MKLHFEISEFLIDRAAKDVPVHVADKILRHHIPIINPIREKLGVAITVSEHSGFRSFAWERSKGRSGTSQHTFGDAHQNPEFWLGAADYTCTDFEGLVRELVASEYRRVAIYESRRFVHCDHKGEIKKIFKVLNNGTWEEWGAK